MPTPKNYSDKLPLFQEYVKTHSESWQSFQKALDKPKELKELLIGSYAVKDDDVTTILTNTAVAELDIRDQNRPDKLAKIPHLLFNTMDINVETQLSAEAVLEMRTAKNRVKSLTGEKREMAEFLVACYEEVLNIKTEFENEARIACDIKDGITSSDLMVHLGTFQVITSNLGQMYRAVETGGDIHIQTLNVERKEGEDWSFYQNRVIAERSSIYRATSKDTVPTEVVTPDIFDMDALFSEVSSRPEFQKFRGITVEKLSDPAYLHRVAVSGEYRLPDRIDFQIKTNKIVDPAAFVAFMEKEPEPERKALIKYYRTKLESMPEKTKGSQYNVKSFFASGLEGKAASDSLNVINYMEYGSIWYRDNIGCMVQKETHQLLEEAGLDWTDMVFIGDKSLREIVGNQYDDMPKEMAEKEKQARVTAAVIKAEEPVSIGVMEKTPDEKIRLARVIPVHRDVLPFQKTEAERAAYRRKQEALNAPAVFAEQKVDIQWKMNEYKPAYSNAYAENHIMGNGSDTLKYMTGGLDPESVTRLWRGSATLAFNELNKPGRVNSLKEEDRKAATAWRVAYETETDPKKKNALKAMYELQHCGVKKTEATRGHGGYLETILHLSIKAKHPEYPMIDIMRTDRCENQELADKIRLEKETMGPQIIAKMGSVEGIAEVMTDCMKAVSNLDLGREADYAAKIPETLTVEERKELCKRPEYEGARAGFFSSIGGAVQGFTQGLESVGGFTRFKMPIVKVTDKNRAVFSTYPEGLKLREKLGELPAQELIEFQHAAEAIMEVSNVNVIKAESMKKTKTEDIPDRDLAAALEADIINEKLDEGGRIGGKKIATGHSTALFTLMTDIPSQERQRMMRGRIPEALKETYFNDEGLKTNLTDDSIVSLENVASKEEESIMRYLSKPEQERKFKPEAVPAYPLYDMLSFSETATLPEEVFTRMKEENARREIISKTVSTYLEEHKIENPGDQRDFTGMIDIEGLDNDQIKEKTRLTLEDYYSGDPQRRKRVLDDFYNRAESLDLRSLNLSLLTKDPPKDPVKRAKSIEDIVRLYGALNYDQARETKVKENPEYRAERYADPEKYAQYVHLEKGLKMFGPFLYQGAFANSGYDQHLTVHDVKMMPKSAQPEFTASMIVETKRFYDRAAHMEGKKTDGILPFVAVSKMNDLLDGVKNPEGNVNSLSSRLELLYSAEFQTDKKEWEKGGITELSQVFFIDGKSAGEYCGNRFSNMPKETREKRIEAEIMAAIASGEHHVDIATMTPTKEGNVDIQMYAIRADLHALDKKQKAQEGIFASLISKKAEKTWFNDRDKAARLEKEQQTLSERMVSAIQKKIQEKDDLTRQSAGAEVKTAPQAAGGKTAVKIASTLEEMCSIQKNADQAQALQKAEKAPEAPETAAKASIPGRTALKLDLTSPVTKTGEVTAIPEKSNKKTI
ncbi:MAG: hypothetical protein LUG90_01675 [Clostridiaceae bacterium]|nr:hypothetical protein [Clostridiaceae bacterium]